MFQTYHVFAQDQAIGCGSKEEPHPGGSWGRFWVKGSYAILFRHKYEICFILPTSCNMLLKTTGDNPLFVHLWNFDIFCAIATSWLHIRSVHFAHLSSGIWAVHRFEAPYAPVPAPAAPTTPNARPPLPNRVRSPPGAGVKGEEEGQGWQHVATSWEDV